MGDAEGVAVEQTLLDRLGLQLGDRFLVGNVPVVATAVLEEEPDRLSRGFALRSPRPRPARDHGARRFLYPRPAGGGDGAHPAAPWRLAGGRPSPIRAILPNAEGFRNRDRNDAAPGSRNGMNVTINGAQDPRINEKLGSIFDFISGGIEGKKLNFLKSTLPL